MAGLYDKREGERVHPLIYDMMCDAYLADKCILKRKWHTATTPTWALERTSRLESWSFISSLFLLINTKSYHEFLICGLDATWNKALEGIYEVVKMFSRELK